MTVPGLRAADQMKFKWALLAAGCTVLLLWLIFPHARVSQGPVMDPEIIKRSEKYVQALGDQDITRLNTEQKLLLLHAHSNLGHYRQVIELAEKMQQELRALPVPRREAFNEMIREAYAKTGTLKQKGLFDEL